VRTLIFALVVAWCAFEIIVGIASIGKERQPITPLLAVIILIIYGALIAGISYLWHVG
jgi:hypothetical protein